MLREASAVVTHAGHGTVLKSLAAGPLVCIPMARDQKDNTVRVLRLGAGVRLRATPRPHRSQQPSRRFWSARNMPLPHAGLQTFWLGRRLIDHAPSTKLDCWCGGRSNKPDDLEQAPLAWDPFS